MTDIKCVYAQITAAQVTAGFYTYDGATVTMMGDDGKGNWSPILLDEQPVTAAATPDMVAPVARVLTKQIRRAFLGSSVEGFQKGHRIDYAGAIAAAEPLSYRPEGVA